MTTTPSWTRFAPPGNQANALLELLAAAVFALAHVMADWLAALVVGILTAVIGFVLIQSGKKQLEPAALKLERTQDALRKDKDMVQRRTS